MFDLDKWEEILKTISKNKLRTCLTAFSVGWGILFLVLILGVANGLQNGALEEFERDAVNSIWVNGGKTSMPYKGMQPGRYINFTNEDYDVVKANIEGVSNVTARNHIWSVQSISYKNESSVFGVMACHNGYRYLENLELINGRFIDDDDVRDQRKVAVMGNMAVDQIFKGEEALGKTILIDKMPFLVVGTFQDKGGDGDQRRLYIPISTGQSIFGQVNHIHQISMITASGDLKEAEKKEDQIRKMLAERHTIAPGDVAGLRIYNNIEQFLLYKGLFGSISNIVWLVGIGTIISGIVGVGNIMAISVRERTKEIGIRKALGATPYSIVTLIMQEAILITIVAGYFGLVIAVGLLEALKSAMAEMGGDVAFFRNPGVDFTIAMYATGILIVAGVVAGLIPAIKAASVSPIAAIRET